MSDTKAKPLAWRKMTGEFMPPGPHLQYQAFMVKTIYYKNLAYVTPTFLCFYEWTHTKFDMEGTSLR